MSYRLINAILDELPESYRWTQKRRDRWLLAFTTALDVLIDVEDDARAHHATPQAGEQGC